MADTYELNITTVLQILSDYQKISGDISLQPRPTINVGDTLRDGSDKDEVQILYGPVTRTLAGGANEELDLGGVLKDFYGRTLTFTKVKLLLIRNRNAAVGAVLEIGGAAANAFNLFKAVNDIYELGPDGRFFIEEPSLAGIAVTSGTAGDLLKISNVSSPSVSIDYDILIAGVGIAV